MSKTKIIEEIQKYEPFNEQEKIDKNTILRVIENTDNFLTREALAHMTASSWIVNKKRDKVLMVYHKIYNSWSWTGGHCDGDSDFLHVAVKEAMEETGLKHINPLCSDIYSLEVLTVDGHIKNGSYVGSHLHLNITYLLEADDNDQLTVNELETKGVKWFSLKEALLASTEPWFVDRIYSKLIDKMDSFRKRPC